MKRYDVVITENAQQDLSFGFRVSSFEFRLIKRFNNSSVQQFNASTVQRLFSYSVIQLFNSSTIDRRP